MLHLQQFKNKGDRFLYAHSGGIQDAQLLQTGKEFKTQVHRNSRNLTPQDIPRTFSDEEPLLASVKYDGEGVLIYFEQEKDLCFAFNTPSGRTRMGSKCLQETAQALQAAGIRQALLAGELYLKDSNRTRVSDVLRVTCNGSSEERKNLCLAFYDILMIDGKDWRHKPHRETWEKLSQIFPRETHTKAHLAEGEITLGKNILSYFQTITENRKLEGLVVKNLTNPSIYKIKPQLSIDAVVLGYVDGETEGGYGVLSMLCGLTAPNQSTIQSLCRVSSGLDQKTREELLPLLQNLRCDNPIPITDPEGRPTQFVKPKIVIEISGEGLQTESHSGDPLLNQTFQWDPTEENYQFLGLRPSARLTHATFLSTRLDKTWDQGGTRMEQALSEETIQRIVTPEKPTSSTPKILLREVYRKENRGSISIRKIIVVERDQEGFHKFTLHFTDFSQGRTEPLKSQTQVAETQERLQNLLQPLQTECQKKGWTKL